ncbi:1938_t:CDS:1, partial [Cetraspora pellucida]
MVYAFPYHLNKRDRSFDNARGPSQDLTVVSNVTLSPDPPKAGSDLEVKGSATTKTNIDKGDFFVLLIEDSANPSEVIFSDNPVDICTKTKCPTST